MLANSSSQYGIISISLHWLVALCVYSLFALGYWMVDLTYYSNWYRTAPYWHKSVGILLFGILIFRLLWRVYTTTPAPLESQSIVEKRLAKLTHTLLYLLMLLIMLSGYLISTADGRPISVFGWFDVPGFGELFPQQADRAGVVHKYLAYVVIALSLLHALAALKHHFIDKDFTLKRMFGRSAR